jgi:hypothetical protein
MCKIPSLQDTRTVPHSPSTTFVHLSPPELHIGVHRDTITAAFLSEPHPPRVSSPINRHLTLSSILPSCRDPHRSLVTAAPTRFLPLDVDPPFRCMSTPPPCPAHELWFALARAIHRFPPRPPTSHCRPHCCTDGECGDCARHARLPRRVREPARPTVSLVWANSVRPWAKSWPSAILILFLFPCSFKYVKSSCKLPKFAKTTKKYKINFVGILV